MRWAAQATRVGDIRVSQSWKRGVRGGVRESKQGNAKEFEELVACSPIKGTGMNGVI
jgi:hypothetical protein